MPKKKVENEKSWLGAIKHHNNYDLKPCVEICCETEQNYS